MATNTEDLKKTTECESNQFINIEKLYRANGLFDAKESGNRYVLDGVFFCGRYQAMPMDVETARQFAENSPAATSFLLGLAWVQIQDYQEGMIAFRHWLNASWDGHIIRLRPSQHNTCHIIIEPEDMADCGLLHSDKLALLLEIIYCVTDDDMIAGAALGLAEAYCEMSLNERAAQLLRRVVKDHVSIGKIITQNWFRFKSHGKTAIRVPRNAGKRDCLLVGTCIVQVIRYLLNLSDEFRRSYRLRTYFTNMDIPEARLFDINDELLASSAVAILVHPVWSDWGNEQAYIDLDTRIPHSAEKITIPYPVFQPLWPFHCKDSRNDETMFESFRRPMGEKPFYPYGDSIVLNLMRRFDSPDDVVRFYVNKDLAEEIDLNRLLERTLETQRQKELITDIKIVDYMAENFRNHRLFTTINHCSNMGLLYMTNQILQRLGILPLNNKVLDSLAELLSPEMPIHPSIIRFFNLKYVNEHTRYIVDPYRRLNFREYVADYVRYL